MHLRGRLFLFSKVQNNFVRIPKRDYSLSQGQAFECFNFALPSLKWRRRGQVARPINRTLIVLLRETYSSLSRRFVYAPPYCSSKETEVPEVVGLSLWLLPDQELVSLGHPVTLGSLSPLALSASLGIEFPWTLHLADFQRRVSALFSSFSAKLAFLPDQAKDLSTRSSI